MIISVLVMMAILAISERSLLKRTHMEHNAALRASEPIVISSGSETDDMDRRAPAAQGAKKRGGPESTERALSALHLERCSSRRHSFAHIVVSLHR